MRFLEPSRDYSQIADNWAAYRAYLESIRTQLPTAVFEFAVAGWHYDPDDHRSLHDSWVQSLTVKEAATAEGRRECMITLVLLGPYHDRETTLVYDQVASYHLGLSRYSSTDPTTFAHGDLLADEITLSEDGNVRHELLFATGARWVIECTTLRHTTSVLAERGSHGSL